MYDLVINYLNLLKKFHKTNEYRVIEEFLNIINVINQKTFNENLEIHDQILEKNLEIINFLHSNKFSNEIHINLGWIFSLDNLIIDSKFKKVNLEMFLKSFFFCQKTEKILKNVELQTILDNKIVNLLYEADHAIFCEVFHTVFDISKKEPKYLYLNSNNSY